MKSIIVWFLTLGLLLCIAWCVILKNRLGRLNESYENQSKEVALIHASMQNIVYCRLLEAQSEGFNLSPDIVLEDLKGEIVTMGDVIGQPTLIYRFSERHCSSCIEHGLRLLKEICNDTGIPVIILCRYENTRKVRVISNSYGIEFPIYNSIEDFVFPLDGLSSSYFFIVDTNLKCHSFQSFIKETPLITEVFLKGICSSKNK